MGFFDKSEKGATESEFDVPPYAAHGADVDQGVVVENTDHLQRRLGNRQIQLIAIGGSVRAKCNTSSYLRRVLMECFRPGRLAPRCSCP